MVELNLAPTRARARALILAGRVKVDSHVVDKAGTTISSGSAIEVAKNGDYVSRGGEKLEFALKHFKPVIRERIALDVGASTGGFTDSLLRHGAAKVYAIDVGYGQLAWQIRNDPRVVVIERMNARNLAPEMFRERPQIATVDVSFISLTLVLGPVAGVLTSPAGIIALIKPQFEAGREHVRRGGVVRDAAVHAQVIQKVSDFARSIGLDPQGIVESPLLGPAGNKEFFIHLIKP
ncbi:MAG: TlyA family RNA methyltransferase [Candidatus Lindowbacteria bacterium]|nr:TlyA family RNA methyltransferase [Candidatus Lindowbacteria bacterium]